MASARYRAGDSVRYAEQTDPWLQWPDGSVVDLLPHLMALPVGECDEECHGGFFAPTGNGPTGNGIERCDTCQVHDGDLDAALALALVIGPEVTVWYSRG
jgi:hypothetical protein